MVEKAKAKTRKRKEPSFDLDKCWCCGADQSLFPLLHAYPKTWVCRRCYATTVEPPPLPRGRTGKTVAQKHTQAEMKRHSR